MKKVIGIIPAAGNGTRLFPYNAGKELLPVGSETSTIDGQIKVRPKIVSQYIIEQMAHAGVQQVIIIINSRKHDLMRLHLDGAQYGIDIAYIVQDDPTSMPHSIDLAYSWVRGSTVVMGMPDTIIQPKDAVGQLLNHHAEDANDLSLGLFNASDPTKFGMVITDDHANITYHKDKPTVTEATDMWGLAVWGPSFTETMHEQVATSTGNQHEATLGDIFDVAISRNGICRGYEVKDGKYYDIGTYEEYKRAILEL